MKPYNWVHCDKPWTKQAYDEVIGDRPNWSRWANVEYMAEGSTKQSRLFFPHCSEMIPAQITKKLTCIGFHCGKLPEWRGGSPIQHQILEGHEEAQLTIFQMTDKLDAGKIYHFRTVSLLGTLEEILLRIARVCMENALFIVDSNTLPSMKQCGPSRFLKRRTPKESDMATFKDRSLNDTYNFIRMLDAPGYPQAFIKDADHTYRFSRPQLRCGQIVCDCVITPKEI